MSVYKKIRASYADGKSQRKIADELGIVSNTVKRYCDGNVHTSYEINIQAIDPSREISMREIYGLKQK